APQPLGRTALMKLCYFLQVLRRVPLGYHFTLYAYGPFDSSVLDDLAYTEFLGAVDEETVLLGNGYGYRISPGQDRERIKERARDFLTRYQQDIAWVMQEFGSRSATDLELLSTMVFVDQEAARKEESLPFSELVRRVLNIKPRFTEEHASVLARH